MPLQDLLTKIKALPGVVAGFLKKGAANFGSFGAGLWQGLARKLSGGKRRFILLGLGALAVLLFTLAGILLVGSGGRQRGDSSGRNKAGVREGAAPQPVPPEEILLPPEPDFVPGVLLGRDRRERWTLDDAEPHWQNPLKYGEEQWRDRIEPEIDDLMERVR
jgi:hypothetical protein